MLGIFADSFLLASGVTRPRTERRPQGVIESPAAHDPERAWLAADRDRRYRGAAHPSRARSAQRRRADRLFWRGRRWQQPEPGEE